MKKVFTNITVFIFIIAQFNLFFSSSEIPLNPYIPQHPHSPNNWQNKSHEPKLEKIFASFDYPPLDEEDTENREPLNLKHNLLRDKIDYILNDKKIKEINQNEKKFSTIFLRYFNPLIFVLPTTSYLIFNYLGSKKTLIKNKKYFTKIKDYSKITMELSLVYFLTIGTYQLYRSVKNNYEETGEMLEAFNMTFSNFFRLIRESFSLEDAKKFFEIIEIINKDRNNKKTKNLERNNTINIEGNKNTVIINEKEPKNRKKEDTELHKSDSENTAFLKLLLIPVIFVIGGLWKLTIDKNVKEKKLLEKELKNLLEGISGHQHISEYDYSELDKVAYRYFFYQFHSHARADSEQAKEWWINLSQEQQREFKYQQNNAAYILAHNRDLLDNLLKKLNQENLEENIEHQLIEIGPDEL